MQNPCPFAVHYNLIFMTSTSRSHRNLSRSLKERKTVAVFSQRMDPETFTAGKILVDKKFHRMICVIHKSEGGNASLF